MNRAERREIAAMARQQAGVQVDSFEFPGGESRKSFRLRLKDGSSVIATRRRSSRRANLEVTVMRALRKGGAATPKVIAFDGALLLQEDVGGRRLSQALNDADEKGQRLDRLRAALEAQISFQAAARATDLAGIVPRIGMEPEWVNALAAHPARLGRAISMPTPDYDVKTIERIIAVETPEFVKWDSRPGNAAIDSEDRSLWFDWEHCGARRGIDDAVWLACDEFTPFSASETPLLLEQALPEYGASGVVDPMTYFKVMGSLHSCVRLELILRRKASGKWWRLESCLENDRIGVTRNCAKRMCRRGRWLADGHAATRPLIAWFKDIKAFVETI